MQLAILLALWYLVAPELAQPNEAEGLYRAFEKKFVDAKESFKLTFEFEFPDNYGKRMVSAKGNLLMASGQRVRMAFNGSEYHDDGPFPFEVTIVADGKQIAISCPSKGGDHVKPESVGNRVTCAKAFLSLCGINECRNVLGVSEELDQQALGGLLRKASAFTLVGKENVGGIEMQIIEYKLDLDSPHVSCKHKLWIDVKTNLPGKRHMEVTQGENTVLFLIEHYSNWQFDPQLKGDEFRLPELGRCASPCQLKD